MQDRSGYNLKCVAGVSNFNLDDLAELIEFCAIPPAVIQGHSDPFQQNIAIRRFALSLGIQFTSYSSLGTQHLHSTGGRNPVLENRAINTISKDLGASAAQVCSAWEAWTDLKHRYISHVKVQVVLKYTLSTGQVIIPRSNNRAHMNESLHVHSLQLQGEDVKLLHSLDGRLHM